MNRVDHTLSVRTDRTHLAIAIVGTVAMLVIAATARVPTYRVSPVFLVPLLWAGFLLRRRLAMGLVAYAMYAAALLLHDLGAYGLYQRSVLGLSFDIYVHFYFAVAGATVLRGALAHHFPDLRPWQVAVTTLLFVMGMGALHEIVEYASYLALGEERGMLKPTTSYKFDTQRDLLNNLLGCCVALVGAALFDRRDARTPPAH